MKDWPIFVISMTEQQQRWEVASRQLVSQGLSFERIPAISGRALDASEIRRVYDADRNRRVLKVPMTAEEIGCYLSHVTAWRRLIDSEADAAIILEDDFVADRQLADVIHALPSVSARWDIIKLHCGPRIEGDFVQRLTPGCGLFSLRKVPIRTLGYAITRQAAQRLAEISVPFARPIDIDHKHFWEADLRMFAVFPSVLDVNPAFLADSTIGTSRRELRRRASPADAFMRGVRHLRDEIRYQIRLRKQRNRR